ncbi:hypothetical protein HPB52_011324 [Rhipicephalus sanguineus]|uniref:Uncharacterized protein n=1 Tax=Rhipicephalus sanguineus TaxID=34632 RepID=A0A9D4PIA5_RHISA|nr:hypothetical protein HPB52_011324 [Rhipicephalus sanguineus]
MRPAGQYDSNGDLRNGVAAMASYLRNSFTLPNRKKSKYREAMYFDPDPEPLSKSELTLYTGTTPDGTQYYGGDRLEDVHASTSKFPDFYGGYPLEEGPSLPRSRLNSTSDYGSELESPSSVTTASSKVSSIFDSATASIYATLRKPKRNKVSACASSATVKNKQTTARDASSACPTQWQQQTTSAAGNGQSSEEFHCCCRNSCHTGGLGGYRMNIHCCSVMEPLWESSDTASVPMRNKKSGGEWYDRRSRHRSCPSFQVAGPVRIAAAKTDRFKGVDDFLSVFLPFILKPCHLASIARELFREAPSSGPAFSRSLA